MPCLPTFPVIWIANLQHIDENARHLLALLTPAEKARRLCFRQVADQKRFMVGRALTRLAISSQLRCPAQEVNIVLTRNGKPKLDPNLTTLTFSIAHSGDLVVVALLARGAVGVDVERFAPEVVPEVLIPMVCSLLEAKEIRSLPTHKQRVKRLLSLWTLKEAYLKAIGVGLTTDPRKVTFNLDAQLQPTLLAPPEGDLPDQFAHGWKFIVMPDYGEYVLALAVQNMHRDAGSTLTPCWHDAGILLASATRPLKE
ncbi:4'-phosphopantetheinyl transferase family protein [Glaciimonas immobilis]|uniref:Phosphopantetheinyl transferase n=1 Tax=Glaciimonas immobilis TaxID=728004 RepID=A0A840RLW9_9BURK|nr:4'-phosphopantetheinyl transferase superfamily protein [Glaciimonas immobilis]KAF3998028.1 4'-phosphopantetheinyl transferase superfamily protein [Glaciimonas immobilis]MBB5199287.1 phosphopantetheinyl transferase [Glaciimonas immobilis]